MVQLPREGVSFLRTCDGQMGPAHKARDDGFCVGGLLPIPRSNQSPPPAPSHHAPPPASAGGCRGVRAR
ncbi:MAG: hypothetical protein DI526_12620 [Caulobacter segnis]|uniref:Uncharacterized protein n=1 Tax=Caulobacter segnis TaxID=88688 RepID=A0A2W5V351_9CAUL|nr:MAG: hypothetical protein DI526_12620 [Caulobacter segnis]